MRSNYSDFIFTGRGSTALWAILESLNQIGAKILLPVNICEIIYPVIIKSGMVPVFYDVDETCGNATLASIDAAYSGSETVLLAVHNFGAPLEIDRICEWAKSRKIFLIEDVCNALGAHFHNKALGSWGDAAIFSFGYAKIIEYGVGGAALVKDDVLKNLVSDAIESLDLPTVLHKNKDIELQTKLRVLRNDGRVYGPSVYVPLYNKYSEYFFYKISSNQVAGIQHELTGLSSNLKDRASKAFRYRNEIFSKKTKHIAEINGQI